MMSIQPTFDCFVIVDAFFLIGNITTLLVIVGVVVVAGAIRPYGNNEMHLVHTIGVGLIVLIFLQIVVCLRHLRSEPQGT